MIYKEFPEEEKYPNSYIYIYINLAALNLPFFIHSFLHLLKELFTLKTCILLNSGSPLQSYMRERPQLAKALHSKVVIIGSSNIKKHES